MKSVNSTKKKDASSDLIILPFSSTEENIDQLIIEMQEEENLSRLNASELIMKEIKMINQMNFNQLSRVA
jgi:hypothetical protein